MVDTKCTIAGTTKRLAEDDIGHWRSNSDSWQIHDTALMLMTVKEGDTMIGYISWRKASSSIPVCIVVLVQQMENNGSCILFHSIFRRRPLSLLFEIEQTKFGSVTLNPAALDLLHANNDFLHLKFIWMTK